MTPIKTFAQLITPDERTLRFTPLGLSTGGILKPEYAAEFQQQVIAGCDVHPDVPEDTRNGFERIRTLHSYGILCYEAFTVADDLSWLVMEQAFRERFVTYFNGTIPFVNIKTGNEDSITVQNFEEVYQAVTRGGSYANRAWCLKLRSNGQPMEFRASFSHLLKWARQEWASSTGSSYECQTPPQGSFHMIPHRTSYTAIASGIMCCAPSSP